MKFLAKLAFMLPSLSSFRPKSRLGWLILAVSIALPAGIVLRSQPAPGLESDQEPAATQPASQPTQAPPQEKSSQAAPAVATPAATPNPPAQPSQGQSGRSQFSQGKSGEVTEDELKQLLVGKQLFLCGGYQGDSLSFTEHGLPVGHPTPGPYTLSGVEIEKVRLTRHKVELIGARYGLHFLGSMPYEDTSVTTERVKITPKKKVLKITVDREQVVKDKKVKEPGKSKKPSAKGESPKEIANEPVASSETDVATAAPASAPKPSTSSAPPAVPASSQPESPTESAGDAAPSSEDEAADEASVTRTTSPAHAAQMLRDALGRIFASGLDDKVKAQMPAFWQLYYQAQVAGVDYRPHDPAVLRSSAVDQQAKVLTSIAPDSNEYAQANGIAGRALYRAVIAADGTPGEIAVVRPIGFGLDENAVVAIRKATFQPATKAGQPVAETLDLAVLFRIYSKRTSVAASGDAKPGEPIKPGPYSVKEPQNQNP